MSGPLVGGLRAAALAGLLIHGSAVQAAENAAAPAMAAAATIGGPPRLIMRTEPWPVAPLRFIDGQGRQRALADFRGKVVLLNIWATWCTPCRKEMPTLDRLQAKLGGPDFEVVALSIDTGEGGLERVRAFYRETGIRHLGIYNDPEAEVTHKVGAIGIPMTLLVDRNGAELGRMSGSAEWDSPAALALIRGHLEPAAEQPQVGAGGGRP